MNSENKDTLSIIFVRILHVVACIIVFFWGGCFLSFASHHNSGDGALGDLGLLLILAVQFVVVLFGLITINVVVHKRSGKLIIPSVLLFLGGGINLVHLGGCEGFSYIFRLFSPSLWCYKLFVR